MTAQSVIGGAIIPSTFPGLLGFPSINNAAGLLIDATGEKAGMIFRVPKSGNIAKVGFLTGTVTTGDTLRVGLYTVSATTGLPTTTAYGGMTVGTQAVADGNDDTAFTVTLGTSATAVVGETAAAVVEYDSYVAGNMYIASVTGNSSTLIAHPYTALMTGGSWAKNSRNPILWLQYDDGSYSYHPMLLPFTAVTAVAYNTGSASDEYGLKFQIPFPARVSGFGLYTTNAGDFDAIIYNSDGSSTALTSSYDKDINASGAGRFGMFKFDSTFSLLKDTNYRFVIKPTTATNITIYTFTVATTTALDQMEGGSNFHLTERVDAGAWTDTTTRRPMFALILDQFDDASGGAASVSPVEVHNSIIVSPFRTVAY